MESALRLIHQLTSANSKLRFLSAKKRDLLHSATSQSTLSQPNATQVLHPSNQSHQSIKMGFFDSWSDLVAAATPWNTVEAEAPKEDEEEKVCVVSPILI